MPSIGNCSKRFSPKSARSARTENDFCASAPGWKRRKCERTQLFRHCCCPRKRGVAFTSIRTAASKTSPRFTRRGPLLTFGRTRRRRFSEKTGHRARAGRNRNKTSQQAPEAQPVPAPSTPAIAPRFQRDYKPDTAPAPAPPVVMETSPRTPSPAPQPPPLSPTPPTVAPDWTTDDKEPPLEPPQLPPLLQPLLLPSDELPRSDRREHIVVIEDSDDSNSGTPFLK
ncbi:unnamed protein product, partial [Nesidiocoris tenuis]